LLGCTLSIEVHHAATTMVPSWDSEPTNVIKICAIVALVTTNNVELHWFAKFSAHTDVFMWPFIIRTAVAPGTTHWRHGTMWRPRRGPTCGVGDSSCRSQCCSTTAMHSSTVRLWFARAAMAHDNPQPQPAEGCIGRICQVELAGGSRATTKCSPFEITLSARGLEQQHQQ